MQTANQEVTADSSFVTQTRNPTSRLAQRAAFNLARHNGQSITLASASVGVSRRTGGIWEAERKRDEVKQSARRLALATKTDLGAVFSKLALSDEVDPRDRVAAGKAHADLMGMNEPTRTQNVNINATVPASTLDLIRSRTQARLAARQQQAIAAEQQPAIDGRVVPPEESKAEALSPSPNISTGEQK